MKCAMTTFHRDSFIYSMQLPLTSEAIIVISIIFVLLIVAPVNIYFLPHSNELLIFLVQLYTIVNFHEKVASNNSKSQ